MTNLERRIIRYRLIDQHRALVRAGAYETASVILRLLRRGHVHLGLRDAEWEAETIFEAAGLRGRCGRGGCSMEFYLKKEAA